MSELARVLAETGQYEQAETMARSITEPHRQAKALWYLTDVLAEAGQHEQATQVAAQAEALARSLTDPDDQAWALGAVAWVLSELAGALAKAGRPVQGRRVVALALMLGSSSDETWIVALGALVSLQPSALRAVAEDVCREYLG